VDVIIPFFIKLNIDILFLEFLKYFQICVRFSLKINLDILLIIVGFDNMCGQVLGIIISTFTVPFRILNNYKSAHVYEIKI